MRKTVDVIMSEEHKHNKQKYKTEFRLGLLDLGFKYGKPVSSLKQRYRKEVI